MDIATLVISLITMISIVVSILLFPKIKIGKIHISTYWLIALIGAITVISMTAVSFSSIKDGLFFNDSEMNPLKILVLFFSMTFISIFLEKAGLFSFLASKAASKSKNNQFVLFVILYLLTSIHTVFTSNDIVILTLTPFICYF